MRLLVLPLQLLRLALSLQLHRSVLYFRQVQPPQLRTDRLLRYFRSALYFRSPPFHQLARSALCRLLLLRSVRSYL